MRKRVQGAIKLAKAHWKWELLLASILVAYWGFWPDKSPEWTGFGPYVTERNTYPPDPSDPSKATREEITVREKKLWDWLELLIIPVLLAGGAALLTNARIKADREAAEDKQREDRLQTYYDRMTELLLKEDLRDSKPEHEVRSIARTRTLATLRTLDGMRKGMLLRFLKESELIDVQREGQEDENPIVDLFGADLRNADLLAAELGSVYFVGTNLRDANLRGALLVRADLMGAHLEGADLTNAYLRGALLVHAHLRDAYLEGADLTSALLTDADLEDANLEDANLELTNLEGANLKNADLGGANLIGAQVSDEQLFQAKSLKGATMPDGTMHE